MWTLALNKFRKFFISAALWAFLPALAAASAIDHVSVVFNGGNQNFVAGIATNTTGSGQIWIEAFTASGSTPHDVGEKIALEILKDGVVVPNAISPSYVTIKDTFTVIYGFPSSSPVPITFFSAGSGLQIRATPSGGGTAGTSSSFSVAAGAAARLVVLAPGESLDPGKDPSTSSGKTGTASFQEPNQAFSITVRLTDNWYNPVSANHAITLASGDLINLPAGGTMSNGIATFNVTITGAKTLRTITAADTTDPSVLSGSADVSTGGPLAQEVFPFPSPFNPKLGQIMTLRFRLSEPKSAKLKILDQLGQSLWQREVSGTVGFNDVIWDGRNENGTFAASGVYYVLLEIDGSLKSKKRIGVVR